jgi:hypothetical protein
LSESKVRVLGKSTQGRGDIGEPSATSDSDDEVADGSEDVCAASPEVEGVTGKYFARKKEAVSSPASYDRESARQLWEINAEIAGLTERATAAAAS